MLDSEDYRKIREMIKQEIMESLTVQVSTSKDYESSYEYINTTVDILLDGKVIASNYDSCRVGD